MIYLDNNATTPIDPNVLEAVIEELKLSPANPSSPHSLGRSARLRLQAARRLVASCLGVKDQELTFTSGATEALSTLLLGLERRGGHVISSSIEHSAILKTLQRLESRGTSVTYLKTDLSGAIDPNALEAAICPETYLIVLGAANSETGVKNPIQEIAEIAGKRNIPFIVDAVAFFGKEPLVIYPGISALVLSGHKIHGPTGVGLIWTRTAFQPLLTGGGQEFGRRSGTENLAAIVGFAKAVEIAVKKLPDSMEKMRELRDYFESTLRSVIPSIIVNGKGPRVANTSNITFPEMDGESLLIELDQAGIAVSLGSACASGALEPSHVLREMGISSALAKSTLRFSLSRMTTKKEVDACISAIDAIY